MSMCSSWCSIQKGDCSWSGNFVIGVSSSLCGSMYAKELGLEGGRIASDKRQQLIQEVLLWHVALYFSKKVPTLFLSFTSQYVLTEKFPFKTDWREHIEPHIAQASHVSTRQDLEGRPRETWPYKSCRLLYGATELQLWTSRLSYFTDLKNRMGAILLSPVQHLEISDYGIAIHPSSQELWVLSNRPLWRDGDSAPCNLQITSLLRF